jgi:glutamine synthetase
VGRQLVPHPHEPHRRGRQGRLPRPRRPERAVAHAARLRRRDARRAVRTLPRSLPEAITALAESATAREWLGEDFVGYYLEMKRAEVDAAATAVTDWEIARYLEAL